MKGAAHRRYGTETEIAAELRVSVQTLRDQGVLDGVRGTQIGRYTLYLWSDVDRAVFGTEGARTRSPAPANTQTDDATPSLKRRALR